MKSFVLAFAALIFSAGVFAQTTPAATVKKADSFVKTGVNFCVVVIVELLRFILS